MNTILLDRATWDLCLDVRGNIALASDPYSIVQDVASACRLFAGELYYQTNRGIPYFSQILGKNAPLSVLKARLVEAALGVPGVLTAKCFISSTKGRTVAGQIQITTASGPAIVNL